MRRWILCVVAMAACGDNHQFQYRMGATCSSAGTCPPGQMCTAENICLGMCTTPNMSSGGPNDECCGQGGCFKCDLDHLCREECRGGPPGPGQCANNNGACAGNQICDSVYHICRAPCGGGADGGASCPTGQECITDPSNSCRICRPVGGPGTLDKPCAGGTGCDSGLTCDPLSHTCLYACGNGPMACGPFGNCPVGTGCDPMNAVCRPSCVGGFCANGGSCMTPSGSSCAICSPPASGGPIVLANAQMTPWHIAVDATNVYWVTARNGGTVMKCPKDGCNNSPTMLVSGAAGVPQDLALDATTVYYSVTTGSSTNIQKCAKAGCSNNPQVLWNGGFSSGGIATDGTRVYFEDGNGVFSCPIGACGTTPTNLGPGGLEFLALGGGKLYWFSTTALVSCSTNGCAGTPMAVAMGTMPYGIAVDGNDVYWADLSAQTILHCPTSGCGSNPDTLASGRPRPRSIVVDATNVYWTEENNGRIMKCSRTSCNNTPQTFVSGQAGPYGIAQDGQNLYWTNFQGGTVMRMAK